MRVTKRRQGTQTSDVGYPQVRINHWANRANARGLPFEYQNIQLHVFYVLDCSPRNKIVEFFDDCVYYIS